MLTGVAAAQQAKHRTPAKPAAPTAPAGTLPVVMLSDLHFDPFYDPAKVARLRAASDSEWPKILAEPDSEGREAAYQKLKSACGLRGNDSSWPLVQSALKAEHASTPQPAFVLNSGDLMAHEFDCRFRRMAPDATAEDLSNFAAKAANTVIAAMRTEFPNTPVYPALGNNDSGCGDYHESPDSSFLHAILAGMSPVAVTAEDVAHSGSYSAAMPQGIAHGRLLVVQDVFQAASYKGCDGKQNPAAVQAELTWLRTQLEQARQKHEQVWVVAHIPPAIDIYNTIAKKRDVCSKDEPVMFLGSNKLAALLEEYAPEIRLAVFAHTHMDEMHVLTSGKAGETVVAKWIPSVSPINGNYPAFTVGYIDEKTAELKDYAVFASDSTTGVGAHWGEEYRFQATYHRKAFTAAEIAPMLAAMRADRAGASPEAGAYQNYFMVNGGLRALALRLVWPVYSCGLENDTSAGFKACSCTAAPAAQ